MLRLSFFVVAMLLLSPAYSYPSILQKTLGSLCSTRIAAAGGSEHYSQQLFEQVEPILLQRCLSCHVEGGQAPSAGANFRLRRLSDATHTDFNFANLDALITERGAPYVLSKTVGSAHGGGSVLDAFGNDYKLLSQFAAAVENRSCASLSPKSKTNDLEKIWSATTRDSDQRILRRAAIVLARRLPTEAEVNNLREQRSSLESLIFELMGGPGFHDFLVTGANDQLHMLGFVDGGLFPVELWEVDWPEVIRIKGELYDALGFEQAHLDAAYQLGRAQAIGHSTAPLELIAHVVENERSYKEVLTAEYTMVTPLTADLFNSEVDWDQTVVYDGKIRTFHFIFKPGKNRGQPNFNHPFSGRVCIPSLSQGDLCGPDQYTPLERPHAGVLTTLAYLQRYPTTETNRNRARARWAYQFFLGVDIEASASRTTDPAALADQDNPTLKNPACTVCHKSLDPVAGAFQNYNELGVFRYDQGRDSLPWLYKHPEDPFEETGYREGDLWFRDMREPGFNGLTVPDADRSLAWLGEKIADDPRFPVGTVEFWWGAVMGQPFLRAPEDPSLPYYDAKLAAFNLQRREIKRLAEVFVSANYRLKPLLVEMVTSKWFTHTESGEDNNLTVSEMLEELRLGSVRRLTPEELAAKTESLTGIVLGSHPVPPTNGYGEGFYGEGMLHAQRTLYGGIDSYKVKTRQRSPTALSAIVADNHATTLACTIEELDVGTADGHRILLNGIENITSRPKDDRATREVLQRLYSQLHGRDYEFNSPEIDFLIDLATETHDSGYTVCPAQEDDWVSRIRKSMQEQGYWVDGGHRNHAWRMVLNYLFSHFDYLYE